MEADLNNPDNLKEIQTTLEKKPELRALYEEVYTRFKHCVERAPKDGIVLELGSGGGFAKEVIPELTTSDIIPYSNVDKIADATRLPFDDSSLSAILLFNVLHHIPDAERFFQEATRCLMPEGRICITDQYLGLFSKPILKYAHREAFDEKTENWKFESTGPLSSANGALPWIIFFRDRTSFENRYPKLKIEMIERHTPLRYWLTGGLKTWSLLPKSFFPFATKTDQLLSKWLPHSASFFTVEIVKSK